MVRLIDADALHEYICSSINEMTKIEVVVDSEYLWGLINEGIENAPTIEPKQEWIPCSEGMPKHSYTRRFWLTVKLDDGRITTLIGRWGSFGSTNGDEIYDAFDCWKDVMINGGIYRLAQPISKEQVLAWMPAPEPWEGADDA